MQNSRSALSGAIRSCAANLIYALMEDSEKKGIYFAANSLNAGKIAENLRFFSDGEGEDILLLEPYEYMLYDVETKSTEQSAARRRNSLQNFTRRLEAACDDSCRSGAVAAKSVLYSRRRDNSETG